MTEEERKKIVREETSRIIGLFDDGAEKGRLNGYLILDILITLTAFAIANSLTSTQDRTALSGVVGDKIAQALSLYKEGPSSGYLLN